MSAGPTSATGSGAARPAADDHLPSPVTRRVLSHADAKLRALLRNGEQLLLTLVLPVLALVVLGRADLLDLGADRMSGLTAGVLALAVMSTAFTSTAISTAFDRRAGVLRLLATTPLGRGGLLLGTIVAVAVFETFQMLVIGGVAMRMGWQPRGAGEAAALIVLGTAAFVAIALLFAGTLRAEAVLAGANLLWVLLLVGGGIVVPADQLPPVLEVLVPYLPSGALGEGLRTALAGDGLALGPVVVLVAWAVLAGTAASRTFRWTS